MHNLTGSLRGSLFPRLGTPRSVSISGELRADFAALPRKMAETTLENL